MFVAITCCITCCITRFITLPHLHPHPHPRHPLPLVPPPIPPRRIPPPLGTRRSSYRSVNRIVPALEPVPTRQLAPTSGQITRHDNHRHPRPMGWSLYPSVTRHTGSKCTRTPCTLVHHRVQLPGRFVGRVVESFDVSLLWVGRYDGVLCGVGGGWVGVGRVGGGVLGEWMGGGEWVGMYG